MSRPCRACGSPDHDACGPPQIETRTSCSQQLRREGKAYPRTCAQCGLGPCNDIAGYRHVDEIARLNVNIVALRERAEKAEAEVEELQQSFDMRWKADMRAIKRWQDETGKDLTWPDHADLVCWLELYLGISEAQLATLTRERDDALTLAAAHKQAHEVAQKCITETEAERDEARAQRDRAVEAGRAVTTWPTPVGAHHVGIAKSLIDDLRAAISDIPEPTP